MSVLEDLSLFVPSCMLLPYKVNKENSRDLGMATDMKMAQLTREMRNRLIDNLAGISLVVSDLCGNNQAMVTRGGVETIEVNPKTMQSRLIKGLYLVGEVLDVDGDTGGYNLQAAFSTGMLAARSIKSNFD